VRPPDGNQEPDAGGLRARASVSWLVACALLAVSAGCAPPAPDLLLLDGRVFTADPERPWAEAVAIRHDRIVAVGSTADVAALASPESRRRELGGRFVMPGLNDAHVSDPQLDAPAVAELGREAAAAGITSMQWFAGGRLVRDTAAALLASGAPQRVRVFRMPRPGPGGQTLDSRPHLPPQPGARVDVRGMGFVLARPDQTRIEQAVSWAYGTEDLLAIEPTDAGALALYVGAVERTGLPEVWVHKRPRLEQPGPEAAALAGRMVTTGMTAVARPNGTLSLASLVRAGVHLALATGSGRRPFETVAWAVSSDRGAEALDLEQALTAFTRGSAYVELSDREKGHLSVGALADLVVLSADPFDVPADRLPAIRSVLTIIGGLVVHDVP